jgi:hypothetical protein
MPLPFAKGGGIPAASDALGDFGQLVLSFSLRQVLAAAITSLNTISRVVSCR